MGLPGCQVLSPAKYIFTTEASPRKCGRSVVVSRADDNAPRALCVVAPCTTVIWGSPYEAAIGKLRWMRDHCVVNVQGLQAVRYDQLGRFLGRLPAPEMEKVRSCLRYIFEL